MTNSVYDKVIGQEHTLVKLRALANSAAHAYLFVGPSGCGKDIAARAFAAVKLQGSEDSTQRTADLAMRGIHVDVHEVEREGAGIDIAQARNEIIKLAARPLTSLDVLCRCLAAARLGGSGVAARRVTDTIKVADAAGRVIATPDRATLWAAETPQVFRRTDLERAYSAALCAGRYPTDEAAAIAALGLPVQLVESLLPNPKVTHPNDAALVRFLLEQGA